MFAEAVRPPIWIGMQCRHCGTPIADKALICYRCGMATIEAKYQSAVADWSRRRAFRGALIVFLVLLALLVFYLTFGG